MAPNRDSAATPRAIFEPLRELEDGSRTQDCLPIEEWGPKCAGCGRDEFRIDGFCSIDCRDYHCDDANVFRRLPLLIDAAEALAPFAAIPFLPTAWDTGVSCHVKQEWIKNARAALAALSEGAS